MLVDAHVHVWDLRRLDYPWLASEPVLGRTFTYEQVDTADGAVEHAVFVQADCLAEQSLAEAQWVASTADAWPQLSAIVAAADLRSGSSLDAQLDALACLETPASRRVRVSGIRHLLQGEPDGELTDGRSARALVDGLKRLAERGLRFDVCVRHQQLNAVTDLLEQVPQLQTVLDHVGKPPVDEGIATRAGRAWAQAIDRLARLPTAHVKLSGLAAEASSAASLDAHAEQFLVHAITAFGPERSMIGSDWPVSALTGATGTLAGWRSRVRAAAGVAQVTPAGLRSIEADTAMRFYGLPVDEAS